MTFRPLPASIGAPCSSFMVSSSGHKSSVFEHGQHSNLTPSIVNYLNNGIMYGAPELHLGSNCPGLPAQATRCEDPPGAVQNNNGSVQRQQIPGSVGAPSEFDDTDECSTYLVDGDLNDIVAKYITVDSLQIPMTHQTVPSDPQQLCPSISPPPITNVRKPKRTKTRMSWTVEMHNHFIDALNQLGGSDNAKPKAILDLMKVDGLARDQVKSHLQKYKTTQIKHRSPEGTSAETTKTTEAVLSDVQINIQEFALRVQIEFQKKLHNMVDKTLRDIVEMHSSIIKKHAMNLHELEKRQKLSVLHLSSSAAAIASSSAALPEDRPALDADCPLPSTRG